MEKQYRHLSVEDRAVIKIERVRGASMRSIALALSRNVSSISREIKRNQEGLTVSGGNSAYDATASSAAYRSRRLRCGRRHRESRH